MYRRLCAALVAACVTVACGGAAPQHTVLTPSSEEAEAHAIRLIAPVRRPNGEDLQVGVHVMLSVSETGAVTAAEVISEPERQNRAPTDVVAEALTKARAATFEPFTLDGVAHPARVEAYVPLLDPERRVSRRVPFPTVGGQEVVMRLSRSACYGHCPVYTVEIRGDGTVRFEGEEFVALRGSHRSQVSPQAVQSLLELFREADFFSLDSRYVGNITDMPTQEVTLTIGGQTKTVLDYAGLMVGMPFGVARLEHAMDRIAGTRRWISGDATTIAALEAERYDFTTPAAGAALTWLAWEDSEEVALEFLARGAPLVAPTSGSNGFIQRGPATEGAAINGNARLLQALIRRDEPAAKALADTMLDSAARSRDLATLEIALGLADFDRRQLGLALIATLMQPAYRSPPQDPKPIVDRLMTAGADVTVTDENGNTALHGAINATMVRRLLSVGLNVDARNRLGGTPLSIAANEDVALALLDAGADPAAATAYYGPLQDRARDLGWTRVSARLAQAGS